VRLAHSVDDFKQGTLAEALELLEKKVYLTEEGAANMIERIWCFEDHCPTPALGFYEGNLQWAKEVRLFVPLRLFVRLFVSHEKRNPQTKVNVEDSSRKKPFQSSIPKTKNHSKVPFLNGAWSFIHSSKNLLD
jgi:hypothetical protein